jgi:hypothetical protein
MFDDTSLKIRLYIWSPLFFGVGAAFAYFGWDWIAIGCGVIGCIIALHIILVSIIRERASYIDSERDKIVAQTALYNAVRNMTNEEKYVFGLSYTPKEVIVKKDNTKEVGNEFSQTWRKLPIAPYKLKVIAQATINGEGFTVRKWAGDGKLLSRNEWDALMEIMMELGMLEYVDKEVPNLGTNWTSFGMDVIETVVKETL